MVNSHDTAMFEIDEALIEVSEELAEEMLGGRRRSVWYRNRSIRTQKNLSIGQPGYVDQQWFKISPTPATADTRRDFQVTDIGLLRIGDLEMRVDRLAVPRETLQEAEFYINDDPDAEEPVNTTPANYDLIGGYVLEGGSGVRERHRSFWVCFLRKRQVA